MGKHKRRNKGKKKRELREAQSDVEDCTQMPSHARRPSEPVGSSKLDLELPQSAEQWAQQTVETFHVTPQPHPEPVSQDRTLKDARIDSGILVDQAEAKAPHTLMGYIKERALTLIDMVHVHCRELFATSALFRFCVKVIAACILYPFMIVGWSLAATGLVTANVLHWTDRQLTALSLKN